ncbi:DUF2935 domain-containing protein [Halalkalibacter sp. APA_J-10(15)]|uniref:DUF2935 domain-containing protein n=1 Tax=unclassified Halalkalibacter TaxID=2893063 RepID=UPI001FF52AB4|nr:DUF2935 domain-containing protein [Halalkalibacter sp. APA_J-10(15)]MCK0472769.1 DUF2935 domain-containing protein [Halalkalibacter sp. APA_J-10(15)]
MSSFEQIAAFENGFWLQVLGDHARFIHDALAPSEEEKITEALYYIDAFDQLLENVNREDPIILSQVTAEEVEKLRRFKLSIIEQHLVGEIKIDLGPTFLNHMVNELDEYLMILDYLKKGESPPMFHELHHHLVWLLDAAGHAGAITDNMDRIEKNIRDKSGAFTKEFEEFYLKAVELKGFLRTNLSTFPALDRFNHDVALEMHLFQSFVDEIEELELSKQALGTFAPLMADHMMREQCYYLIKLAESTDIEDPNCDPTKPRLET